MPLKLLAPLQALMRWPVIQQVLHRSGGVGRDAMSPRTRALRARTDGADTARSVCPYCGVGCGQLIHHRDGRILSIEGDPESPINQGTLCPKGAASKQLLTHDRRLHHVLYRAPGATAWQQIPLERAMDMIAERVWRSRARTWIDTDEQSGEPIRHTTGIAHLGGATLDNEENYLIRKLFTAGLGMVAVSNQARI